MCAMTGAALTLHASNKPPNSAPWLMRDIAAGWRARDEEKTGKESECCMRLRLLLQCLSADVAQTDNPT